MKDVLGHALSDYYYNTFPENLWIHNKYGRKENMPVSMYFRPQDDMPELEIKALAKCKGRVLDIGAGAGSHALVLQQRHVDVTALEISQKGCRIMKQRGVSKVICKDVYRYDNERFDTLLMLMNGIGLMGTIQRLREFLQHAKRILNPDGQLLFDSSDVAYVYKYQVQLVPGYYGEIMYRYEYKERKTAWFKWLYIDKRTLRKIAAEEGWQTRILFEDKSDQYLAKLVLKRS